jgi:hypothetical protein
MPNRPPVARARAVAARKDRTATLVFSGAACLAFWSAVAVALAKAAALLG